MENKATPVNAQYHKKQRSEMSYIVNISAKEVNKNEDGTFQVVIEARALPGEVAEMLHEIFPDVLPTVHSLLRKQALISSIIQQREF